MGSSAFRTAQSSPVCRAKIRRLRRGILVDCGVAIEMVGRKIEQHGDPRVERVGSLELKAARLDHVNRVLGRFVDLGAERVADVAAHEHAVAAGFEHAAGQRGRRRFALGSGDRHDPAAQPPGGQLQLADHRHAGEAGCLDERMTVRHAGTRDDELGLQQRRRIVSAQLQLDAGQHAAVPLRPGVRRTSVSVTDAPRRTSSSAAATPLRAAPTTVTRLPRTEKRRSAVI